MEDIEVNIRRAVSLDKPAIIEIMRPIVKAGETYAIPTDFSDEQLINLWFSPDRKVYVAEYNGEIVGTYYIRPNFLGPASHIGNGGFMVAPKIAGRGVGRAMGHHAIAESRKAGFKGLLYNIVVSSNQPSIQLWESLGFKRIGTVPNAYDHAKLGLIDAYQYYLEL